MTTAELTASRLPAVKLLKKGNGKIRVKRASQDRALKIFLILFAAASIGSVAALGINWGDVLVRTKNVPEVLSRLAKLDFADFDVICSAFLDSISVAVLATVYSLLGGLVCAVFLAKNITPFKTLRLALSAVFTFIRAVPSIIWVLLVLVCVGFGPAAGIVGISIYSISFFARAFAQCFEEVPEDTIEALRAMGAGRVKIFFSAVLPSSLTALIAWTAINFENNFGASSILGMVGAGGIGYVISASMASYNYGRGMVAIILVLIFTFAMEIGFTALKKKLHQV
jgi:phosphonate transport system permease protein